MEFRCASCGLTGNAYPASAAVVGDVPAARSSDSNVDSLVRRPFWFSASNEPDRSRPRPPMLPVRRRSSVRNESSIVEMDRIICVWLSVLIDRRRANVGSTRGTSTSAHVMPFCTRSRMFAWARGEVGERCGAGWWRGGSARARAAILDAEGRLAFGCGRARERAARTSMDEKKSRWNCSCAASESRSAFVVSSAGLVQLVARVTEL